MKNYFTAEKTTKTLRLSISILVLLLVFSISVIFLTENSYAAKKIRLAKRTVTVCVGSYNYNQELINKDGKYITSKAKWRSKKPSIAKIGKDGTIKGIRVGTVRMSAKYKGKTYKFTVKVKNLLKNKKPSHFELYDLYESLGYVALYWDGNFANAKFQIYVSEDGGKFKLCKTTTHWYYDFKNIQEGVKYRFKVREVLGNCKSKFTSVKSFYVEGENNKSDNDERTPVDHSAEINSIVSIYTSRKSWDDSVPRLNWYANEASMKLLRIIAHDFDQNNTNYSRIESADDIYISRKSWDDSVPRLDWYANEASMKLVMIIAHELDKNNTNYSTIESKDDSYIYRKSWDDSVPRLDWYANEASMNLYAICTQLSGAY